MLGVYAPHLGEELWEKLGYEPSLAKQPWPEWIEELTQDEEVEIVCQINGKIRDRVSLPVGLSNADLEKEVFTRERIKELTSGKTIRKVIVVPNKLVNIVVGN
jgi:leucyl-tRNA synthetase